MPKILCVGVGNVVGGFQDREKLAFQLVLHKSYCTDGLTEKLVY